MQVERFGAMANYPRLMSQFAATAFIAATLSTAAPAMATDRDVASEAPAAVGAKTAPPAIERHVSRHGRIAASRHGNGLGPIHYSRDCSGIWCGRQFVLMVGIAY